MKRMTSSWIAFPEAVRCLLALTALTLAACYEPKTITCSTGLVCPERTTCSADGLACLSDPCGDSIRQASEACDDGNKVDGDGCSSDCRSTERCGNGIIDRSVGEVCDDSNTAATDGCSADCKSTEICGNRVVDLAAGEVCDDGNRTGGDGCSAECSSNEDCGNGITDFAAGEVCDDGNGEDGDRCSANCQVVAECGNGTVDVGEECDDGNPIETDECLNTCKLASCGDGRVKSTGTAEECDTAGESPTCTRFCTFSRCGDRITNLSEGEQCDTGGADSAVCTADCTISYCGDGYTNHVAGEDCDYNNPQDQPGCPFSCKIGECGDGELDAGEACDDGNDDNCGLCNATCTQRQPAGQARGTIEVVRETWGGPLAGLRIHDGWKFTISDGINLARGYEFEKRGGVEAGYKPIEIKNDWNSARVAQAIKEALAEDRQHALAIDAEIIASDPHIVKLTHERPGTVGNQIMVGVPANEIGTVVKIRGMSGGSAKDCTRGTSCTSDNDCVHGLSCDAQTKTCK